MSLGGQISQMNSYSVLGVRVNVTQIDKVIAQMQCWIERRDSCHFVVLADMHVITQAHKDRQFHRVLSAADLVVPDGMPLVWLGRRHGFSLARRVYGPELMDQFWAQTCGWGYRHFFYGGAPGVADALAARFSAKYPGHSVVGTFSPPYRPLTPEEDGKVVSIIKEAQPDVLWVGLGAPKQERWMFDHSKCLHVPVLVGVGAAFDLHTGRVRSAPLWMKEYGLEWLFRLSQEPVRLWRRYLVYGSRFVAFVVLELVGIKKFH